jgi:DnaJ-class molecular chaperone
MICPRCHGTGQGYYQWQYAEGASFGGVRPCTLCNGSGRVRHVKRVYRERRKCEVCNGTGKVTPPTPPGFKLRKPLPTPCQTCGGKGWYMPISEPEYVDFFEPEK